MCAQISSYVNIFLFVFNCQYNSASIFSLSTDGSHKALCPIAVCCHSSCRQFIMHEMENGFIFKRWVLPVTYHIIIVCNCNSNGTTNEVCEKLDGSCICSDGNHRKQCQFGESCNKLCQLQKFSPKLDYLLKILTNKNIYRV